VPEMDHKLFPRLGFGNYNCSTSTGKAGRSPAASGNAIDGLTAPEPPHPAPGPAAPSAKTPSSEPMPECLVELVERSDPADGLRRIPCPVAGEHAVAEEAIPPGDKAPFITVDRSIQRRALARPRIEEDTTRSGKTSSSSWSRA
jgi:hypothetical protein